MFIGQSVARRRTVRRLFLGAAVVPCVLLVWVAWWRHSAGYVAEIERAASAHLGLPVRIGAVVHPRPGVLRLRRVVFGGVTEAGPIEVPDVEVETTATEVRLRLPRVACAPDALRLLGSVVAEWLDRPTRFPKSWVVDVDDVGWRLGGDRRAGGGWHAECVVADDARAVRLRREPASADEVRVRKVGDELVVEATIEKPIPALIAAALLDGGGAWAGALGPESLVLGGCRVSRRSDGWTGRCQGAVEHWDAASILGETRPVRGEVRLEVAALEIAASRITRCDLRLSSSGGLVAQETLDELVGRLGCRPGPAHRALGGDAMRRFDELACRILVDADGLRIRSTLAAGGSVMRWQGLSLLDEPAGPMPAEQIAWFLAPPGRPPVPAAPASAWLISVLPHGNSGGSEF